MKKIAGRAPPFIICINKVDDKWDCCDGIGYDEHQYEGKTGDEALIKRAIQISNEPNLTSYLRKPGYPDLEQKI